MFKWDATIRAGDIVAAGTFAIAVLAAYVRIRERLVTLEIQFAPLWTEYTDRRTDRPAGRDRS
jgi:hypothetical protein